MMNHDHCIASSYVRVAKVGIAQICEIQLIVEVLPNIAIALELPPSLQPQGYSCAHPGVVRSPMELAADYPWRYAGEPDYLLTSNVRQSPVFSGGVEEFPCARCLTGIHALGYRPEARHVEESDPKDRTRQSPETRTPPEVEYYLIGRCSVTRRPNRKSWPKRYGQPRSSKTLLMGDFCRVSLRFVSFFMRAVLVGMSGMRV